MIFLREINPLSLKLLERIYRQSRYHQVRQRAHFLILACQGIELEKLMRIFNISYKTIYNWINRWESQGIVGLYNKPGRGRKRIFKPEQEAEIREWAKQEPRQLKKTLQKIKSKWDIEVSTETIKRILRKFYMSWHRMRRRGASQFCKKVVKSRYYSRLFLANNIGVVDQHKNSRE